MKYIDDFLIWMGWKEKPKPQKKVTKTQSKKAYQEEEVKKIEKAMRSGDEMALTELLYEQTRTKGFSQHKTFIELSPNLNKKNRVLTFNFIPKKQANRNVRSYLGLKTGNYKKWQDIRNINQERALNQCVACGCSSQLYGKKYHTECHENWIFGVDEGHKNVQKLEELQALCFLCHKIKHLNQELNEDLKNVLLERYAEINKISALTAKSDYDKELEKLEELNNSQFVLELSALESYDIKIQDRYVNCHSQEFNEYLGNYQDE